MLIILTEVIVSWDKHLPKLTKFYSFNFCSLLNVNYLSTVFTVLEILFGFDLKCLVLRSSRWSRNYDLAF